MQCNLPNRHFLPQGSCRSPSREVARLRAPVARVEGARSFGSFGPWRGRRRGHGYLDSVGFVVGTHGYLDSGMGLGRAGPFFAGASIVFIAFASSRARGCGWVVKERLDWLGTRRGFVEPPSSALHGWLSDGGSSCCVLSFEFERDARRVVFAAFRRSRLQSGRRDWW